MCELVQFTNNGAICLIFEKEPKFSEDDRVPNDHALHVHLRSEHHLHNVRAPGDQVPHDHLRSGHHLLNDRAPDERVPHGHLRSGHHLYTLFINLANFLEVARLPFTQSLA